MFINYMFRQNARICTSSGYGATTRIRPFWAGLDAETAMRDRDPKFRRLNAATQNSETNKWRLSNGEVSLTMWRFSNDVVLL